MISDWPVQFYIKSKPIFVGVSINDCLNYIAYIIRKGIKYPDLSPFLQRQKTATCTILQKKIINGVFVCLLFFLKVRHINQIWKDMIKFNRNLRSLMEIKLLLAGTDSQ